MYIATNEYIITLKKNMVEANVIQEIRLTNINETTNQTDLMSKKHNEVCIALHYIEHLLVGIPIGI